MTDRTDSFVTPDTTAREQQRKIEMSDSTWIVLIDFLIKRRARPSMADAVGWLATVVLASPVIVTRGGDLTLGDFGPDFWFIAFILLAGFSLVMAGRAILIALHSFLLDIEFDWGGKRRHLPRKTSWVPCETAEFVEFVRRRLQEEQHAAQESANAVAISDLRKQLTELAERASTRVAP